MDSLRRWSVLGQESPLGRVEGERPEEVICWGVIW